MKKVAEDIFVDGIMDIEPDVVETLGPQLTDDNWDEYVMSLFKPEELVKQKHPTVNGLRRVCEIALGPIVGGQVNVVQSPSEGHPAVVEYEITIQCDKQRGPLTRVFSSAADAHSGNTDQVYRQYLTAIAETRAEARAIRKALKIKIAASDELSDVANLDREIASPIQLKAITNVMTKKKLSKEDIESKYGVNLESLTSDEAKDLIRKLNS